MNCRSAVSIILSLIVLTFTVVITLVYNLFFVETSEQNIVSVNINNVLINGRVETTVDGKQISVFRGIPYAEPPLNELRFKKPVPLKNITRTINAYEWPNPCYQYMNFITMEYLNRYHNRNLSEDCLYLNIWSPIRGQNESELRPVIFYIHQGSFLYGSAVDKFNTGEIVAEKGDVVFININYRLSTLGFLYTGQNEAPGNVGFWDQALALEWVKDNIKYFGGDPHRITIMGLSSGSISVSLHILSPISRNLYRNAMMQSGAATDKLIGGTPQTHIEKWLKGAELIGCNDHKNYKEFSHEIIECMRRKDPKTLVKIPDLPKLRVSSKFFFPLVVVDGEFLPKTPSEMLSSGDFKHNFSLLLSTTQNEGSIFLLYEDFEKYDPTNPINLTFSQAVKELDTISSKLSNEFEINVKEVTKVYFNGLSDKNSSDSLRQTIGMAIGDFFLFCPTLVFAKEVYKNSGFQTNIYQYLFNYKSTCPYCPKWMGVCHGCDFYPSLGTSSKNTIYTDKDRDLSEQMIEFITTFAKNDVPTKQNGIEWPRHYETDGNITAPYYEIIDEPKPDINFGVGLKTTECECLWKKYLLHNG